MGFRKRLIIPLVFLLVCGIFIISDFVPEAHAALALDGSVAAANSGTKIVLKFTTAHSPDVLFVISSTVGGSTTYYTVRSITDNVSLTFTQRRQEEYPGAGAYEDTEEWVCNWTSSGNINVNITLSGTPDVSGEGIAFGVSGAQTTSSSFDSNSNANPVSDGSSYQQGALTISTSNANDMLLMFATIYTAGTLAAGTSFTSIQMATNSGALYDIVSSTKSNSQIAFSSADDAFKFAVIGDALMLATNFVTLNSPSNGSGSVLTVNFTYTPLFYQAIGNATLYTNATGSWAATQGNTTTVVNSAVNAISFTFSSNGNYTWNVGVNSSSGQTFASANWTVFLEPGPFYSNVTVSTSIASSNTTLSALWNSPYNVSSYVFGSNVTGVWVNGSAVYFANQSSSEQWSSPTVAIPYSYVGCVAEPNVLYEANPYILTNYTYVFKMWFRGGWNNAAIEYAESADGKSWTEYSGNPILNLSSNFHQPSITEYNGVYYLYVANGTDYRFHSSNGVTGWVKDGSYTWGGTTATNTCVWVENGTWYGVYEYSNTFWNMGEANSTNGLSWTDYSGNPVIGSTTIDLGSGPFVEKINGVYWLWCQGSDTHADLPSNIYRFHSTNLETWVQSPSSGTDYGSESGNAQIADPSLVQANGNVYMYYDTTANGTKDNGDGTIDVVVASAASFSGLVNGWSFFYNSTAAYSNITVTSPSTVGTTVQWEVWADDTPYNVWANTGLQTLTLTSAVPEFQPLVLLPLFMITTLLGTLMLRKKRNTRVTLGASAN